MSKCFWKKLLYTWFRKRRLYVNRKGEYSLSIGTTNLYPHSILLSALQGEFSLSIDMKVFRFGTSLHLFPHSIHLSYFLLLKNQGHLECIVRHIGHSLILYYYSTAAHDVVFEAFVRTLITCTFFEEQNFAVLYFSVRKQNVKIPPYRIKI